MKIIIFSFLLGIVCIGNCWSLTCQQINCNEENCKKISTECINGDCNPDGSCQCYPCFDGIKCSDYKDLYHPIFLKKEDTIYLDPTQKGLIYEASARDDDNYKTCNPDQPCPCGESRYEIIVDFNTTGREDIFEINHDTGDLILKETAITAAGDHFTLQVATSNFKDDSPYEQNELSLDMLTLHIRIREETSIEDYFLESEIQDINKERSKYLKQANEETVKLPEEGVEPDFDYRLESLNGNDDIAAKSLARPKRDAIGSQLSDINFTLEITNEGMYDSTLKPGNTISFSLTMIFSNITTSAMDLLVELFVMDAVTGITTFALCNVEVQSIGGKIKDSTQSNVLMPGDVPITMQANIGLSKIYDRAVISFGQITNAATEGSADYADSTIVITFDAVLIPNSLFTNVSAIITAGAEFDNENNVWVSQAISGHENTLSGYSYPSAISALGVDTMPQWSSTIYDIEAFISHPYAAITVEIFTPPGSSHDQFSVESLSIKNKGANSMCTIEEVPEHTTFKSITGKTNHRITYKFTRIGSNLLYSDLATANTDVGNKMLFTFNIFMLNALVGDIVSIGAGITIGGNSVIWVSLINVTVTAGDASVTGGAAVSITSQPLDTSTNPPEVNQYMTAAWNIKTTLTSPTSAGSTTDVLIDCVANPGTDSKICGVMYGNSGLYIGKLPDLNDVVVYNVDGSATWSFVANTSAISADQVRTSDQDYLNFEVTVMYLTAVIAPTTVLCSGTTLTLTAQASASVGIEDLSGTSAILGTDSNLYAGANAAIQATLTFPEGGYGYNKFSFEVSGDFLITDWGVKMCHFEVYHIGRGVGCLARSSTDTALETNTVFQKSLSSSLYNDGLSVTFEEICGSKRDDGSSLSTDQEVIFRVFFEVPTTAAIAGGEQFNSSMGVLLDDNLIWTGWTDYTAIAGVPTAVLAEDPIHSFVTPVVSTSEISKPILTKLYIKMHPGTIRSLTLTATSSDTSVLEICRIVILNVGRNFACIDQDPYGKHIDPEQRVTIVHDSTNWGSSAVLNLGLTRNFGTNQYIEPSFIADEDTIEIVTIVKGIGVGSASLTLVYNDGREPKTAEVVAMTITDDVIKTSNSISMIVTGLDETLEYSPDVMKQLKIELTVPNSPEYDRVVEVKLLSPDVAELGVCYMAVTWTGMNVPCVIPSQVLSTPSFGAAGEPIFTIMLTSICYVHLSSNVTESKIIIRAGVMVRAGVSSTTVNVELIEDATITATETVPLTTTVYVPQNMSEDAVKLSVVQNETVTLVTPGEIIWLGVYIEMPPYITVPAEFAVMTSGQDAHAYATVSGFRWGTNQGKNIQCKESIESYTVEYMQNSTTDGIIFIHESQKDTLTADLKYMTNTGISYQHFISNPEDDLAMLEAEIYIADHEALVDGAMFNISFSIKIGTTITVVDKTLTIDRTGPFQMVLVTTLNFTDSLFDPNVPAASGERVAFTTTVSHVYNLSQIEAYSAIIRFMMPPFLKYVNGSDLFESNIPAAIVASQSYVDVDIGYLFFTDILEMNFSLTVDPNNTMVKGLGVMPSALTSRLICKKGSVLNALQYCGYVAYVNYNVAGTECYEDLEIAEFESCQFLASSAIDSSVDAQLSAAATGWSPAVRDITTWDHYIIIDFKIKTRVTKIVFDAVTDIAASGVGKYKLQSSMDGLVFNDACGDELLASNDVLPTECRIEARFARINLITAADPDTTKQIGVSFMWYGCYLVNVSHILTTPCLYEAETPLTTNIANWAHCSFDETNNMFYFCDYNPMKMKNKCYSTADSTSWNSLPSYIGSLVGYDATTGLMYAHDTKKRAMMSSINGIDWVMVDVAVYAAVVGRVTSPSVIPAVAHASTTDISCGGGWIGNVNGLYLAGAEKVKWDKCCS